MKYYTSNNELPGPHSHLDAFERKQRERFHLPHHFDRVADDSGPVPVIRSRGSDNWDWGGSAEDRAGWSTAEENHRTKRREGSGKMPNWIRKDKQILRFYSYFTESIVDQGTERERRRRCIIFYYLEDDSVQVMEPVEHNSGIPQGTIVRRHRIPFTYDSSRPKPSSRTHPEHHITFYDLNVGCNLNVYGRVHRIVDCDGFTREFLEGLGISVPQPKPLPDDEFNQTREKIERTNPLRPYKRVASAKFRLEPNSPKILRFFGRWEDKETRLLNVHFYLEDETIEIVENHDTNCGRYKAPMFLKRCRLPKDVHSLVSPPGHDANHVLLNVVRSKGPGRVRDAVLIDNLETNEESELAVACKQDDKFFNVGDFELGKCVTIGGREIMLYDCDEFTKTFYKETFDKDMVPVEQRTLPKRDWRRKKYDQDFPPYNGFGSEEDSKTSCNGLEPRPPQRDFYKFMNRDRTGFESFVLRFSARLVENDRVDTSRKFVVSFFLSDDTILVNQIADENSGRPSGRFLLRCRIKKPREYQIDDPSKDSLFYLSPDFYVGAIVKLNDHVFLLTEADDYVFAFMERDDERERYPHSNVRLILNKLDEVISTESVKTLMARFMAEDSKADAGTIHERMFRTILREFIGYELSEHELITLTRHFRQADLRQERLPEETLFALLQNELKRAQFTSFAPLLTTFQNKDTTGSGMLSKKIVRHTLVGALAAPGKAGHLRSGIIRDIIDGCLVTYDEKEIDYERLLNRMNYAANPCLPIPPRHVPTNFYEFPLQNLHAPILYRDFIQRLEEKKGIDTMKRINEHEEEVSRQAVSE